MQVNDRKPLRAWAVSAALLIPSSLAGAQGTQPSYRLDYDVWLVRSDKGAEDLDRLSGTPDETVAGARQLVKAGGEHVADGHAPMVAGQSVDWTIPLPRGTPTAGRDGPPYSKSVGDRVVIRAKCDQASASTIAISMSGRVGVLSAGAESGVPPTRSTSVFELSSIAPSGAERVHDLDPGGRQPRMVVFVTATSLGSPSDPKLDGEQELPADLRCDLWRVDDPDLAREIEKGSDRGAPKDVVQSLSRPGKAAKLIGLRSPFLPNCSASVGFVDEQPTNVDASSRPTSGEMHDYRKQVTTLAMTIRRGKDGELEADIRERIAESPVAGAPSMEPAPLTLQLHRSGLTWCRIEKSGDSSTYLLLLTRGAGP